MIDLSEYKKHPFIVGRKDSILIIIDIQEKLYPKILEGETLILNLKKLIKTAKLLEIPIIITEQEKLGQTLESLRQTLGEAHKPIRKISFSCMDNEEFRERLEKLKKRTCILTGIEGHVCIEQTALDLSQNGYKVHVIEDAISSRKESDLNSAFSKMKSSDIIVSTTEMVMYELMRTADDERFKEFLEIVKGS